jgi:hypothetical protein
VVSKEKYVLDRIEYFILDKINGGGDIDPYLLDKVEI